MINFKRSLHRCFSITYIVNATSNFRRSKSDLQNDERSTDVNNLIGRRQCNPSCKRDYLIVRDR